MKKFMFYQAFKNIDKILMSFTALLLLIGLITLASAVQQNINLIGTQIINILIGIFLLILLSHINPKRFLFYAPYAPPEEDCWFVLVFGRKKFEQITRTKA